MRRFATDRGERTRSLGLLRFRKATDIARGCSQIKCECVRNAMQCSCKPLKRHVVHTGDPDARLLRSITSKLRFQGNRQVNVRPKMRSHFATNRNLPRRWTRGFVSILLAHDHCSAGCARGRCGDPPVASVHGRAPEASARTAGRRRQDQAAADGPHKLHESAPFSSHSLAQPRPRLAG